MIEISQIRIPCGADPQLQMESRIRKILRLKPDVVFSWRMVRHAVDARKKPDLYDVYSVRVSLKKTSGRSEKDIVDRVHDRNVRIVQEEIHVFPRPAADARTLSQRPVVIGTGPAGLFCSLMLARAGFRPIVFERGQRMEERVASVNAFWEGGVLNGESNIQFGEGGAGTFSDGKLTSNVRDSAGRVSRVLETFVAAGAPEEILYEQIPHIGTDRLRGVIRNLRKEILSLGGIILFNTKVTGILVRGGRVAAVRYRSMEDPAKRTVGEADGHGSGNGLNSETNRKEETLPCSIVVLAPGHSARDTIRMLKAQGIPMEAKPFAVGLRVSHPQELINSSQYGLSDPAQLQRLGLSPASYKLTASGADGRGVYSFCMCPGGYVVNASSEEGRLAVNGMSDYLRDSARANSAIVMSVSGRDYGEGVLDGLIWQEKLEEKAFRLGNGRIPAQRFTSFEKGILDGDLPSEEELCIKGAAAAGALHELLPETLTGDFIRGMHEFGRKIRGFDGPEAFVIGLESRTSSPVRILRDAQGESEVEGLFPCGEGAGYAGGITSAAVDGIRIAEHIARRYRPCPFHAEESCP